MTEMMFSRTIHTEAKWLDFRQSSIVQLHPEGKSIGGFHDGAVSSVFFARARVADVVCVLSLTDTAEFL